ncbi:hypothetical protein PAXRUDRAFT_22623 [Paxillus rubicundulus Ve08.2h10]|uniref:Uncharacterized protein n=1 Tax=Paxillus rubicundulus Ve08.2h10 TaxID=930991 RepID=A0A0D0CX84_9AGAM|nr:hypothetical protein PAXRUDRAFT_22623 [Paxillus rubicundulus Ve08.2h10]
MEAGGSKVEGKQSSDGNEGGKGGEKGKKKEKKEKKEKKIERVEKGSDGGQDSRVVQPEASMSSSPATTRALLEAPTPPPFNNTCDHCIWQMKDCTRRLEKGMPPLSQGKGGLQSIPAGQVTPGAVKGSSPSPGTSKGSIPRPLQRPNSSICSGDFEAPGYPLQAGPKLGTWPFHIKEGQGLSLQIVAQDAFTCPKGKIQ